jgi:hypothetical protein
MSCICLRLGTVHGSNRPRAVRQFATLLSPNDLMELYRCAVAAPADLRFGTYYGVSNNTWRFWDLSNAKTDIGFEPSEDTERYRGQPFEGR